MKRFKYLYFTNIVNKPYFNFWFLKKLKVGGGGDDGNLLSQPEGTYSGGGTIVWTWEGMTASGTGKAGSSGSYLTGSDYLPLKKDLVLGETYKLSVSEALPRAFYCLLQKEDGTFLSIEIGAGDTERTFTLTDAVTNKYRLRYSYRAGSPLNVTIKDIKLGYAPSTGEGTNFTINAPFDRNIDEFRSKGDIYQTTYTGKNFIQVVPTSSNGLTSSNVNGELKVTGTATDNWAFVIPETITNIPADTYTMSIKNPLSHSVDVRLFFSDNTNNTYAIGAGSTTITFGTDKLATRFAVLFGGITNGQTYNEQIQLQLEKGSTATDFEPYVGGTASPNPDYPQDIKVVTGEQTITITDNNEQTQEYTISLGNIELCKIGSYQDYIYKSGDDWYVHKAIDKISSYNGETITTDYISTTGVLTNGATVYYCLTTPTDTKLTDTTLINQLEVIVTTGTLHKGLNTITVTSDGTNLPSIIYIKSN